MNYCGKTALTAVLGVAVVGGCQSSSGQTQGSQSGQALQQNQPKTVTPPATSGDTPFSPDSAMCTPTNSDAVAKSRKSPDPHAKPPSSLPATTAPGGTTPCVGTNRIVKSPSGEKQAEPPTGITPVKPLPNRQNNSPSPFDSTNRVNVATSVPRLVYGFAYQTQSDHESPDRACQS